MSFGMFFGMFWEIDLIAGGFGDWEVWGLIACSGIGRKENCPLQNAMNDNVKK
ncbi:MAG: hypothetical protein LBG58_03500 [Planctomycetaceae bacterium]|jgi:hypothetical protein|nr:hypothetical protein [Planctomycetaceae bacterium]